MIELSIGWKVDFIIRKTRAFSQEEFRRRRRIELNDVPLFVASAEDIIVAKLEWSKMSSSVRQLDDVASIFKLQWESLDQIYLEKWIGSLQLQSQWEQARDRANL